MRGDARSGALAELRRVLGVPLRARRIERRGVRRAASPRRTTAPTPARPRWPVDLAQDLDLSRLLQEIPKVEDLLESRDDAPVIRLINALFTQALRDGASDIHIEPFETRSVVRLAHRRHAARPDRAAARAARGDRLARQDHGAARHRGEAPAAGRPHHAARRAASRSTCACRRFPTGHGERVVLRLLDKQAGRLDLARLGMDDADARAHGPADHGSRTASSWSPARPARARPPRSTPRCRGSTRARSTS